MQVILGSNGVIGKEVAKELHEMGIPVRLASRNPKRLNEQDELFPTDLKDLSQVKKAVKGCEVAYLTVGLEYKIRIWQKEWPMIMKNVIESCKSEACKLVFFDNVYCYGKVEGWMTEETQVKPSSKKGAVRAELDQMIKQEIKGGNLKAIIARSADFYGPDTPLSFFNIMVIQNLLKGKPAQWMLDPNKKHSLTYTPDAGRACAILGNKEEAYDKVWHLPTDKNAMSGQQYIDLCARIMDKKPKIMVLQRWFLSMLGLFINAIKENQEMLYQMDSDYLFDSSKFEQEFNFKPTTYKEGMRQSIEFYENQ